MMMMMMMMIMIPIVSWRRDVIPIVVSIEFRMVMPRRCLKTEVLFQSPSVAALNPGPVQVVECEA